MNQAPTVLIVHDDREILGRLVSQLESRAEVWTATNFEDAKSRLAERAPSVLITSLRLGEYNGLHLIIRCRIDHPATVAFVISPRSDPAHEAEALKYDATFLCYPDQEGELLARVAAALARRDAES